MRRQRLDYEDFVVLIGPHDGAGHRLSIQSPAGECSDLLRLPFSDAELARLTVSEKGWKPRSGKLGVPSPGAPSRSTLRKLGNRLFEAMFRGETRDLFYKSRGLVEERRRGLRLRLQLDPENSELAGLFSLPWELLRPAGENFLALSREVSIVRHPEVPRPGGDRPLLSQLRVLVVMAEPEDQPPLGVQREWQALASVWREHPTVRLVPLANPSLDRLLETLEDGEFHVLHFMGHGGFDTDQEEWVLCFQGEGGKTEYVRASLLGEQLADLRHTLRLVVLNACQTGRLVRGPGVAMAMVSAGMTAVVAMQAVISDRAAIELSKALYHRLAAGDSIERALAVARKRIRRHEWTGAVRLAEWATPVLFLRSAQSQLFDVPAESASQAEPRNWKPSWIGLAALLSGGLGLAAGAGLGSLWVMDSPLRSAAAVATVVLGGLGWLGRRLWALYESKELTRDFSRAIAARRGWLALLFALPLLAFGGWAGPGMDRLIELRCSPLGAPPPGVRRLAVVPWTAGISGVGASRQEGLWASEITDQLTDKLRQIDSLQLLVWREGKPEQLHPCCVDLTLSGRAWQDRGAHLRLALTGPRFEETILERSDQANDLGNIDHLGSALIFAVIEALGIEVTPKLRLLIETPPTNNPEARKLNRLGVLAFLDGDFYEAENKLRGALALDPRYSSAYNNLGRVLTRKEPPDDEAAAEQFRRAIAIRPHHALYHFNLGLALEKHATRIRSTRPEGPAASPRLLREAVDAYGRAIERNRAYARAYNNLGFTLLELGELDRAREQLEQGRNLATEKGLGPYFEKNLGRVALAQGMPEQAVKHLERAIRLYPEFPEALYFLALGQEALAERRGVAAAEACETLRRYAAIADRDPKISRRQDAWERLNQPPCGD